MGLPAIHDLGASIFLVDFEFDLLVEAAPASNILGSPEVHVLGTPTFLVGHPFLLVRNFPQLDYSDPRFDDAKLFFLFFQNVDISKC